ncbi:O-glycosyl hydrolase [Malassezia pachydermatis]|uniref:Glycoside hydrolase family 16 protein n=1 Tax=Malassezia pachydermatis TaxID=77020 RepID=A0A0M9VQB6_9BASI|nr:glycoside hydrolase family 16 protein [Malassezia pachydermatis]KOS15323.1 glycoside hydrolase family 16 protein [Malassezia pachydermatis]
MKWLPLSLSVLTALSSVQAVNWQISDKIQGQDYYEKFNFISGTDANMTQGLVVYQGIDSAKNLNLTSVDGNKFTMRVDTTKEQHEGRPSIRIESKTSYNDSVIIMQASHVPTGCAVWPAFWTVTNNQPLWPKGGEIDILENVNDQFPYNLGSVHLNTSCSIQNPQQTGTTVFTQCNALANQQSGCRVAMNGTNPSWSYADLNQKGGVTVAMERDFSDGGKGIRMWLWAKGEEPSDVKSPGKDVNPDQWGVPNADFGLTQCSDQFNNHNIIFDITLCGSWAGNAYTETTCPSQFKSCSYQVGFLGDSFKDAYWVVDGLYVYTPNGVAGVGASTKQANDGSIPRHALALTYTLIFAAIVACFL